MVDDADYDLLAQYEWCVHRSTCRNVTQLYAIRGTSIRGRKCVIRMHRFLLGCKQDVDHRDGNSLNNQRENLRPASRTQNNANMQKTRGSSQWKGVSRTANGRWRGSIQSNEKGLSLGTYRDEADAAQAYNFAAEELFGEFARLNKARPSAGSRGTSL